MIITTFKPEMLRLVHNVLEKGQKWLIIRNQQVTSDSLWRFLTVEFNTVLLSAPLHRPIDYLSHEIIEDKFPYL